ncbi:hemerythrin domain-containing protein [Stieleria varia]|uniref:Hemerythrin-like domain-containing protein n=1 Tax=Stieleria varia TaxID=2528005 RepID=A0A5C5ZW84_9BACT|nr:hemerythrin domain-containing protein [Stieleria varia]TWT91277.1 hypothetical protein Pla52n_66890 [Stieleria varia]
MSTNIDSSLCQIFADWRDDDLALQSQIDELRRWMAEVTQLGIPRFGEMAGKLKPLQDYIHNHFARELSLLERLVDKYPEVADQVDAVRRQTNHDHDVLGRRLQEFIDRLNQPDPPFDSWTAAIDELELIVDALEQHEDQESESLHILMPKECEVVETKPR